MPSSYTIGPHFEAFVQRLLASGRYSSASEVMRDGLRLLEERQRQQDSLEHLQRAWQEGIASGEAGPLDIEAVKQEARARMAMRGR
ncbi:type II toxin-antitoxin system ParD family antitoxin [Teichococcus cervicalis]|uniref:Addiction module antidote protein, CC2985 family n=1 Tax=Pseudoroseomonas cervicalis ATCC 49957 TaxID=525371 RepID=D5RG16_9PROT|nr:type II toxin-antitoxin system ParD family antitoxin [Pseudoroseomonas cervicalis]EFH13746.1 addiction module antidote protein, CC2985 family [Pseudoroseomonas cervicalis ATCC 49957]